METKVKKLSGGRSANADFKIARIALTPPAGTTLKEVLHPQYFINYLQQFKVGMELSVLSEDFELDVRLRVLATDHKFRANVRVLDLYSAPDAEDYCDEMEEAAKSDEDIEGVSVTWGGPNHKWRVVVNGEVVEHGFANKDAAQEFAEAM